MASSLICCETQSRVSSVLNRDVKQYGKKYMFDSNEETCWNSDQGECQWVSLEFPRSVQISLLRIQFQGGFSAKQCRLEGRPEDGTITVLSHFYPEDNNSLQSFPIQEAPAVHRVKIVFENSADFFGRVIVYSLDIMGEKSSCRCYSTTVLHLVQDALIRVSFANCGCVALI
ncbi:nuclear receptor 2C2-associated protein [Gouania willdenowi]|uniref:Nuclear receptor 2C2-associated protein n=1 Tax=Gouania willdenowi TaxID=441366 RepID=A0A8C5G594_GOUWI|nr:nuclear receptor 2C2-associated protein [Gouania willdenowi]